MSKHLPSFFQRGFNFQNAFYWLFNRFIHEVNPTDLGTIPSGLSGLKPRSVKVILQCSLFSPENERDKMALWFLFFYNHLVIVAVSYFLFFVFLPTKFPSFAFSLIYASVWWFKTYRGKANF